MRLTRWVVDNMMQTARDGRPEESCGIVLAVAREPGLGAVLLRSHNVERTRPGRRYELDHRVHIAAVEAEVAGTAMIVGYYHSHVRGPARPSRVDAELACPGVTYVIASADEPQEVRAWRYDGRAFVEEIIHVEEPAYDRAVAS
ncbi:MAG: Mov34/MPN/PAD-1 family protein [Planctomycetota bacterium]|jgi:proteasome lid subunit RPN8/RPN11